VLSFEREMLRLPHRLKTAPGILRRQVGWSLAYRMTETRSAVARLDALAVELQETAVSNRTGWLIWAMSSLRRRC